MFVFCNYLRARSICNVSYYSLLVVVLLSVVVVGGLIIITGTPLAIVCSRIFALDDHGTRRGWNSEIRITGEKRLSLVTQPRHFVSCLDYPSLHYLVRTTTISRRSSDKILFRRSSHLKTHLTMSSGFGTQIQVLSADFPLSSDERNFNHMSPVRFTFYSLIGSQRTWTWDGNICNFSEPHFTIKFFNLHSNGHFLKIQNKNFIKLNSLSDDHRLPHYTVSMKPMSREIPVFATDVCPG